MHLFWQQPVTNTRQTFMNWPGGLLFDREILSELLQKSVACSRRCFVRGVRIQESRWTGFHIHSFMVRVFDCFDRGSLTILLQLLIVTDRQQTDVFVIWPTNGAIVAVNRFASSVFLEAAVDQKVGWKLGRCHWMAWKGVSSPWSMCRKLPGVGQEKSKQKKEQKIIAYLEVLKMMEVVEWLETQLQKPKRSPWDHLNSKAERECPQRL